MNDETKTPDAGDDLATRVVDQPSGHTTSMQPERPMGLADFENLALLDRLELPIEVRLGRLSWELEKVLGVRVGDAVPIGPDGDDVVTLYVQGRPYAVGDLVVVDGRFAFRVRDVLTDATMGAL